MNASRRPSRIVLADPHNLVRAGLRALLEQFPDVEIVGEASNSRQVVDLVKSTVPDAVLLDITMPDHRSLQTVQRLTSDYPDVRVIILALEPDDENVSQALRAGAVGCLLKTAPSDEFETTLQLATR